MIYFVCGDAGVRVSEPMTRKGIARRPRGTPRSSATFGVMTTYRLGADHGEVRVLLHVTKPHPLEPKCYRSAQVWVRESA